MTSPPSDNPTRPILKRIAAVLVITVALASVLAAVVACLVRPDPMAALALIPPWCFLVPGAVAAMLVWRLKHPRFGVALLIFWLVFACGWVEEVRSLVHGVVAPNAQTPGPGWRPLRVVSMNCAGTARCIDDLNPTLPDIVLLQEVPSREVLADIARALWGETASVLAAGDTAILARGRIEPQLADPTSHFSATTVVLNDGHELACISLRLTPPPSRFDFWTSGFWREHRGLRDAHRREVGEIVDQMAQFPLGVPLIVAGDFNTTPLDRALDALQPRLVDSFARAGQGLGGTGTNDWPLFRVDQVWTSPELACRLARAEKTRSSDHRLVVCELWLPPLRPR